MTEQLLSSLEAALAASRGNTPLIDAYIDAAVAAGAATRAAQYLQTLAIEGPQAAPRSRLALASALLETGDASGAVAWATGAPDAAIVHVRALLMLDLRDEARRVYTQAVERNPAIEDKQLEAELDRRVVHIGERAQQRVRSVANEDTDAAEVVRLLQPPSERVSFADVGGLEPIKAQIRKRIITPFQKPSLFERFRKKAGGGVLLYGPPGCGKTLLARATAGECGATFHNVAVSDVLDLYIGESERKLHAIFELARRNRPAVLFFDEVEALGGKRQHTREATSAKLVSQFLSELDGFAQNNDGVLILAATNMPWAVDPAFRRPGRFDRVLFVPPPDAPARAEILNRLLASRPTSGAFDIAYVVGATSGYSGADLAAIVETAVDEAIEESIAAGRECPVTDAHLRRALAEVRSTTLEWLTSARNHARYANEGGQYDDVLAFLKQHGR